MVIIVLLTIPLVLVPSLQRDLQSPLIQQRHGSVCVRGLEINECVCVCVHVHVCVCIPYSAAGNFRGSKYSRFSNTVYSGLFSRRLYFANSQFNSCSRKVISRMEILNHASSHINYLSRFLFSRIGCAFAIREI